MAITGVNNYNNAYESVYATKQKEETKEASAAQKKTDTENKSSLLSRLQDKYSNFDITEGTFSKNHISSSSRGFQGVMVNSAYLSKAENDEATAKELNEMLSGVESAYNWLKNAFAKDGLELVSCGYYIDENGEMGSWSVVKKKDSMFDGLKEESEKSADRIKEKQEKAREQKKVDEKKGEKTKGNTAQLEERLEKKREASHKAEKLLSEKLKNARNGEIYFDSEDMQTIIEAVKSDDTGKADTKGNMTIGANLDLKA